MDAGRTCHQLGVEVSKDDVRHAGIGAQQGEHSLLALSPRIELHRRDPKALLETLLRIGRHASGNHPAQVGVVGHGRHQPHELGVEEDGSHHEDVGKVHAAVERVVDHGHVARVEISPEAPQNRRHRLRKSAELVGQGDSLGDYLSGLITQGGGEVHGAFHRFGVRCPKNAHRHLFANRRQALADQFPLNGGCSSGSGHDGSSSIITLWDRSRKTR